MYFDCGGKVNHFFRCKNHTFTVFPPSLQIMTKKTAISPSLHPSRNIVFRRFNEVQCYGGNRHITNPKKWDFLKLSMLFGVDNFNLLAFSEIIYAF